MGADTKIEWTKGDDGTPEATWNPVTGCTRVSEGCRNCYMARVVPRHGQDPWTVVLHPDRLGIPLHWKKPRRIFVNSLSDLFHKDVPDGFIDMAFAVMAIARRHTFQVLTKRPKRMLTYLSTLTFERLLDCANHNSEGRDHGPGAYNFASINALSTKARFIAGEKSAHWPMPHPPLPNVWLGISCENQATADERIPLLLQTPSAMRFISAEPLLGPINLSLFQPFLARRSRGSLAALRGIAKALDWVIVGGESGPHARPMHPDWARSLRNQCQAASVPFFFKQWGEWAPFCVDALRTVPYLCIRKDGSPAVGVVTKEDPGKGMQRVGKHAAGRVLDGRTWDEMPKVPA